MNFSDEMADTAARKGAAPWPAGVPIPQTCGTVCLPALSLLAGIGCSRLDPTAHQWLANAISTAHPGLPWNDRGSR